MNDRLAQVNHSDMDTCVTMLEGLVERSPWVVRRALAARPFATPEDIVAALTHEIRGADRAEKLSLIRAHSELTGCAATATDLTRESSAEQDRLGLLDLASDDLARLDRLNKAYRDKFGIPFIVALHRLPDLAAVLRNFETRLSNLPEQEQDRALNEIIAVVQRRTLDFFAERDRAQANAVLASHDGQTPKEQPE